MTSMPDQLQTLFATAVRSHTSGQLASAVELYNQVIALDPLRPVAFYNRGMAQAGLGAFAAALDSHDRAIALEPRYGAAYGSRGDVLLSLGRLEDAVASYDRAIELNAASAELFSNRGAALQKLQRDDLAIASYDRALALRPDYAQAYNNRGIALQDSGRLEEALASYRRAAAIDPAYAEPRRNAFWIHLGDLEDFALIAKAGAESARLAVKQECDTLRARRVLVDFHLVHDLEQTDYLMAQGYQFEGLREANDVLREVHSRYRQHIEEGEEAKSIPLADREIACIVKLRDTLLQYRVPETLDHYLHPDTDWASIEQQYFASAPEIVHIDNFLAPRALEELRKFCLVSSVWKTDYQKQYLGAFAEAGFISPLHFQIALDLQRRMPRIFGGHRLEQLWSFKYSSKMRAGLNVHADFARVNLNFWVTPDAANLDPTTGGLVVHAVPAPANWRFQDYNNDDQGIQAFLKRNNAGCRRIPHRCNRAVLFNSSLFHETDAIHFKAGYENRRINVTYLFGRGLRTQ